MRLLGASLASCEGMGKPSVTLVGLGGAVGEHTITLDELATRFGLPPERITARTGVTALRRFGPRQSTVRIACSLARSLLEHADLPVSAVRGVFGSSNPTGDNLLPTWTASVANALGLRDVIVDHVGIGCCGVLQAMRCAYNQLVVDALDGHVSHCLVVSADQTSRILDPALKRTGTLFGEGAAVALLTNDPGAERGYAIAGIGTKSLLGDALESLRIRNPYAAPQGASDVYLEMDGAPLCAFAAGVFDHFRAIVGRDLPDGCYVVPHQPNLRMLESMIETARLDPARVYVDGIRTIGNTSAPASLLGLEDALRRGLVAATDPVLLGAFGAELQVGAALLLPVDPSGLLVGMPRPEDNGR
jgi:3-oxoacyl-[acyl-carrier-protein] synthase-3